MTSVQTQVLQSMDKILTLCRSSQEENPAESVAREIVSINFLRNHVQQTWPLTQEVRSHIFLGVYAARNLDDWTPRLAGFIMALDNVLKRDGAGVDDLLARLR